MKNSIAFIISYFLLTTLCVQAQVQWASKLIDFSSEYKDDLIRSNSTRWSAVQVLGYPNSIKYGSSQLAWTPQKQDGSKEFVTVGFNTPQTVQQVMVGENYNAGSVAEIILYDANGKKYTVYENEHPQPVQKLDDILTYFKVKPTYNVVKLKLVINTNSVFGRQEIDCIGISSTTAPYKQNVNVVKYSEAVGQPENLGPNVNSEYYDHLPLISPDGSLLYFTRKLTDDENTRDFNDDIYVAQVLPTGKFGKAENIGPPLNTSDNNFVCFISHDNNRLYVANKYIKNTYNYAGLSVSTKQKDGSWSKPKPLNIPDLYNKNEFAHYHMNLDENIVLMSIQRDDSYGDLDLYVSQKYSDGDWSAPKNLGPVINTVGAEGSVFLAADGRTLYFSSSGHPGYGSYDMYMSKRLDDSWTNWSKPLNLGDKINTDEMDIYYTIPASGDYAYFSSGVTYFGKNDLYRIKLPKEARPEYVDIKKFVANAPLKKSAPITAVNSQPTPQKPVTSATPPITSSTPVVSPPTTVTKAPASTQTDDLQKKLEELKKQQTQVSVPIKQPTPTPVSTAPAPIQQPVTPAVTLVPPPVASTNTPAVSTTPRTEVKREVLNTIQPYQTQEEQRPKPAVTNTIQPVEMPKPAPKVLTAQELAAREQQKNNPTVNPNSDNLNALSKRPMTNTPVTPAPAPAPPIQRVQNPNIVTNEVDPDAVTTQVPVSTPSAPTTYSAPLKTSNPQVDDLQQKLDALKQQQTQATAKATTPSSVTYTAPVTAKSIAEQYPDPQAVLPASSAKTDDLQQRLDALKQQQREVGQSNKLAADPYAPKPYAPQPVKERQDDAASKEYDDYQKKLEALKQQQKSVPPVISTTAMSTPTTVSTPVVAPPSYPVDKSTEPSSVVEKTPVVTSTATNPIISKYEEKLRKLKEEMATINPTTPATDTRLTTPAMAPVSETGSPLVLTPTTPLASAPKQETAPDVSKQDVSQPIIPVTDDIPPTVSTPIATTTDPVVAQQNLEAEKAKLDSIQQAQKAAEQKMLETLDKMGSSKQSLEKDIADLQGQRQKFSEEKDKLTAQNSQLAGEKEKLEAEKKKMDDLLVQMQAERDKLAAEKKKMEEDKAKLEALKKQQEKDVLTLKRSIDSLAKVQQKTTSAIQQNYDLFNVPLQVGAVAQVNNIYFVADAAFLQIPSYPELDKVVLFLARNKNLKVEIGGHTNGLCDDYFCQKLSTSRAKTCVDYLVSKGIAADRLTYKGYGKTQLLKPNEPGNALNQRVEIKIISVD